MYMGKVAGKRFIYFYYSDGKATHHQGDKQISERENICNFKC